MIFNLLERHRDKWVEDGECYRWIGALANGRPQVGIKLGFRQYKGVYVSRMMCEEAHGPPPSSKHDAAHDTPNGCIGALCVNGEHLRWATRSENIFDMTFEERSDKAKAAVETKRRVYALGPRQKAKLAGENKYYTGIKCDNGHDAPRYTRNGACIVCHKEMAVEKTRIRRMLDRNRKK